MEHLAKVKALLSAYTASDGSPVVMSDLDAQVGLVKEHPLLAACAPGLYYSCILGKLRCFKTALAASWDRAFDAKVGGGFYSRVSVFGRQ